MRRAKNGAGVVNMRTDDAQKVDLAISQYVYPDLVHGILLTLETGLLHVLNRRLHFTSQVISSSRFKPHSTKCIVLAYIFCTFIYPIIPTFFLVGDVGVPTTLGPTEDDQFCRA
jgi:hypothetical protein